MNEYADTVRADSRDHTPHQVPDIALVVRGASRGLTVLLLGGVVQPWVGAVVPPLGYVWLALVAIAAFAWAAWPRGAGGRPNRVDGALVGSAAALCSYLLVLPLVVSAAGFVPWSQVAFTTLTALVVGALTGGMAPRRPGADR